MLKLSYTESGLYLEHLSTPLEQVVQQRVLLALRLAQPFHIEPSTASFLLVLDEPSWEELEDVLEIEDDRRLIVTPTDEDLVEVTVEGTWVADTEETEDGTFVTALSEEAERFIYQLWAFTEAQVSSSLA
ncbi:MAG: alr0857 family protein [Cyanobacteria bacterium J06641_5]